MKRKRAFTLIELLVVISIIALLIGILLPTLGAARATALRMKSNSRVRGVHQACVQYAQGNQDKYVGLGADESAFANYWTTSRRFNILMTANFFTPEYALSPAEDNGMTQWVVGGGQPTTQNFAFAFSRIGSGAATDSTSHPGRRTEWAQTLNSEAPVIYDRNSAANTAPNANNGDDARSIHSDRDWRGSVAYNDNHTLYETNNELQKETKFGAIVIDSSLNDDLFEDENVNNSDGVGIKGSNAQGIWRGAS
jgi:prepilin-type N-terminal cleavage/methylation domain-containing protein